MIGGLSCEEIERGKERKRAGVKRSSEAEGGNGRRLSVRFGRTGPGWLVRVRVLIGSLFSFGSFTSLGFLGPAQFVAIGKL